MRFDNALAVTGDVDIAAFENLKLVIEDEVDPALPETFKDLNLRPAPGLDRMHAEVKLYRKARAAAAAGGGVGIVDLERCTDEVG